MLKQWWIGRHREPDNEASRNHDLEKYRRINQHQERVLHKLDVASQETQVLAERAMAMVRESK